MELKNIMSMQSDKTLNKNNKKTRHATVASCYVAGRSGGHIIPALTLAQEWSESQKKINPTSSTRILFFSTDTQLDTTIVKNNNIVTDYVAMPLDNIPSKNPFAWCLYSIKMLISLVKSFYFLYKIQPQKIVSTGGYLAIPVCIAGKILRIPIELYELNVIPGRSIKFLAPLATTIFICFEKTKKYFPKKNCRLTSYPIRFNHALLSPTFNDKAKLLRSFGLEPDRKTIFILGGSQGSLFINKTIKRWLENTPHLHEQIQIIHQTGSHDRTDWEEFYYNFNIPALLFAYHHEPEKLYAVADLIICRSGAGTLFEIAFFNKQCITIPLETAQNYHQVQNGKTVAELWPDLVTVIRQKEIETHPQELYTAIESELYKTAFVQHTVKNMSIKL